MKNLRLCLSDKAGGFVVLDASSYNTRAFQGINKNFRKVEKEDLEEAKSKVRSLLDESKQW